MANFIKLNLFLLLFCTSFNSQAKLEFDSKANKVQIYGPFVKYNVLKKPYALGRYQFSLNDIRLEKETLESGENQLTVFWPRFLLNFGQVQLFTKKKRQLLLEKFSEELIGSDEKYGMYKLEDGGSSLLEALKEPFQICLKQTFESSKVRVCSNFFTYDGEKFVNNMEGSDKAASLLNKKKAPKNAQINLSKDQKKLELLLKFKSGFSIHIKDNVRQLKIENVVIDPREKRLGIVDGKGSVRPIELTTKDRLFSFIKENNYFKNQYQGSKDWPQDLEDAEMEFAPYLVGASAQLYGLILPHVPPPFDFKLHDNIAIATYSDKVELTGTKRKDEVLAAKNTNELFIKDDQTEFLWNFKAPKVGELNQRYLSLQHKGEDYYFSKRIFRSHQGSLSASAAVSTTQTLGLVPGYNFSGEYWFEKIWDKSKYSFQRWGLAANVYETIQGFKPSKDYNGKLSVNPLNLDLLFRFKPGVRPVQSSFGLGVRYLNFTVFQSQKDDAVARLIGIGGFWHTAPQKIIDDIFNIVPFFRYPKWMELSFFYYPMLIGNENLKLSFSWQIKGKMFFRKNWYASTSFNVNLVSFTKATNNRLEKFGIGTAHGTFGVGYLF